MLKGGTIQSDKAEVTFEKRHSRLPSIVKNNILFNSEAISMGMLRK